MVRLSEDEAVACHNTCTHQQQPLNEGYLQDDDTLICPAHNSRFDLHTGEPIGIPAVTAIPIYACKIEDEAIWVDFDQQTERRPDPAQAVPLGRVPRIPTAVLAPRWPPAALSGDSSTPGTRAALRLAGSHLDHEAHRP